MSDRMTNNEIEDVLSSIRRLVSEEARYPFRSERKAPEPEPVEKLMLTPDFRVVEPQAAPPAASQVVPEPKRPAGLATPAALAAKVAALETAAAGRSEDWEPDGSEVPPSPYLSKSLPEPAARGRKAPVAANEPWPEPILAEAAAAAEQAARVEAELAAGTAAAADRAVPEAGFAEVDDAEAEMHPQFAHRAPSAAPPNEAGPEDEAEELDEEGLRELIRGLIREELQGALGERISRNLRKMVRAEINRALAGRELG